VGFNFAHVFAFKYHVSAAYVIILLLLRDKYGFLKRLVTPSDFHIPLPSIVPFAHSETSSAHGCIYPIFPGSSGTT
jgi:hypothetical protein